MQNIKSKILQRNGKYYAIIKYCDEYGLVRQKWLNLGINIDANIDIQKIAKQKIEEFNLQNIKKMSTISKKITNKRSNSHMLFSNFAEIWLKSKRKNIQINTYDDYIYEIKIIKKYFDTQELKTRDILPSHIDGFFDFLYSNGVSNNTILHYYVLLNQIFKFAIKNNVVRFNVMDKVDRPKKEKFEHKFYTANQIQQLLDIIEKTNCFIKVPVSLASIYGLRRSEIIGLKWSSIDFENKKIYINHKVIETNKNGKSILYQSDKMKNEASKRELPLTAKAFQILQHAKQQIESNKNMYNKKYISKYCDYVCVDSKGKLISPHRLTTNFAKFLKENNLPKIRFHDLRHSCASMLVANGVSMKSVQEWLGHSNFGTTANIYSHLDFSAKQQSADKIEQIMSNGDMQKEKSIQSDFQNNSELSNLILVLIQKIDNLQSTISKLI